LRLPPFLNTLAKKAYIRIRRDWMSVRIIGTDRRYDDIPQVAMQDGKIRAVGRSAESYRAEHGGGVRILRPFDHPRMILADFDVAVEVLQHFLLRALGRRVFVKPIVILHPLEEMLGGLTAMETKALLDLALRAGAGEAHLLTGDDLSDENILSQISDPF
jgi:rod shape-determining protein MreB